MLTSLLLDTLGVLIALCITLYAYYKWSHQYWARKNLNYLPPSIPYGNMLSPFGRKINSAVHLKKSYEIMRAKGWKHAGVYIFSSPAYTVLDLDLVKNILIKDFQYFVDRGIYYNDREDPLSAHLFAIGGTKWRNLRTKMTPTFTSGKMKMMFHTLVECLDNLESMLENKSKSIDIKDVLGRFTTDIIGSVAFGLDFNTFQEDESPFRKYGKKAFVFNTLERVRAIFAMNFPDLARKFHVKFLNGNVSKFFMGVVKDTVEHREKNNYTRKDFMQLLIDLKNGKEAQQGGYQHDGNSLTVEEIAAQCFVFFLAGFETSSTTMTFALYELAKNPHLQEKLRKEVLDVLKAHDGELSYDSIQDMKYMNQVIDEALRKYPPVPVLFRRCVKDYLVPEHNVVIEKGTRVQISVLGIHRDPEYYPDPEKFDPERFTEENKRARHPCAHLPFGEGPRLCIGMRFGLMQTKVGLAYLLKNYRFTVNKKTEEPITYQAHSLVLAAKGEIWLDAHKLS